MVRLGGEGRRRGWERLGGARTKNTFLIRTEIHLTLPKAVEVCLAEFSKPKLAESRSNDSEASSLVALRCIYQTSFQAQRGAYTYGRYASYYMQTSPLHAPTWAPTRPHRVSGRF